MPTVGGPAFLPGRHRPGRQVQVQTNNPGLGANWTSAAGGTVSPTAMAINPANRTVFLWPPNP